MISQCCLWLCCKICLFGLFISVLSCFFVSTYKCKFFSTYKCQYVTKSQQLLGHLSWSFLCRFLCCCCGLFLWSQCGNTSSVILFPHFCCLSPGHMIIGSSWLYIYLYIYIYFLRLRPFNLSLIRFCPSWSALMAFEFVDALNRTSSSILLIYKSVHQGVVFMEVSSFSFITVSQLSIGSNILS